MPKFEKMPLTSAPQPMSKARQEQQFLYASFIQGLGDTEAGKLQPDEGESVRGIKVRLTRAAKDLGKTLEVWDFDNAVFFRHSGAKLPTGRGRPRKQP